MSANLEEERARVSARLHDEVGQLLTASLINIDLGWAEDAPEGLKREVLADLRAALEVVRELSLALSRPPAA
ncbi:MAG: histidine kinase [Lysobacteraceae bacterium]|jgi:signal transduction histidine kinase